MGSTLIQNERGVSPVIGAILMVAIVVVLAVIVGTLVLGIGSSPAPTAPQVSVSHTVLDGAGPDGDDIIAVTLESGDAVEAEKLYVTGSTEIDIGSEPGSSGAANDSHASKREKFTESTGGGSQVGIGETWDAGETVYFDPNEDNADGVTIKIYWNNRPVEDLNPGEVEGEDSYKIAELTV
jgi:flagellin-like protein